MVASIDKVVDRIDRLNYRVVYVALALLLAAPFIIGHWEAKPRPRAITRGLYDTIEDCAESGKPVFLINAWRMSSRGENQPQFEVVVDHMMRRRVKFIMLSFEPDTAVVGRALVQKIEQFYKEEFGEDYIQYGRDWLMLGFRPFYATNGWLAWAPLMKTEGIVGSLKTDYMGKDLWKYPIMARPAAALGEADDADEADGADEVDDIEEADGADEADDAEEASDAEEAETVDPADYLQLDDFGLILEIHFTGTVEMIIGLIRLDEDFRGADGKPKIEVGLGTVNMVVNQMLPYYDTGDLCGVLAGVQGAAGYSELLQDAYGEGPSRKGVTQRANPYSMGVLCVLSVIILGNLCTLWKKLRERGAARGLD